MDHQFAIINLLEVLKLKNLILDAEEENLHLKNNQQKLLYPFFFFFLFLTFQDRLANQKKNSTKLAFPILWTNQNCP